MSDAPYRLLALSSPFPPGFEEKSALGARDVRRGAFALYAASLAEAEAAIAPFGDKLLGLLITPGSSLRWEKRGRGLFHLAVPEPLQAALPGLIFAHLQLLEALVVTTDLEHQKSLGLTRAADDRARLVREFAGLRESLLKEISERRAAELGLQEAHDKLETRVIERTAELAAANASLKLQIAERRRAEASLQVTAGDLARSNAELEQFAYVASHDLQEPLRTVASFVQLLELRYRGRLDAEADRFIHFVVSGANRMQALIRDLLAFSRVGTQADPFVPTDCGQVLREVLKNLQAAIQESGATISVTELPCIIAAPSQISRLFQNLIGNALKFRGPNAPQILVSGQATAQAWHFSVSDNGIGIDARHFERIFMIFQRLHPQDNYEGTGIGLPVCRKIVERHGGRIWVESEANHGSTFYFTLPRKAEIND